MIFCSTRLLFALFSILLVGHSVSANISIPSQTHQSPPATLGSGNYAWLVQPIGSDLSGTATDLSFYYNIVSTSTNKQHNAFVNLFEYTTENAYNQELAGNLQFPNNVKTVGVSASSDSGGVVLFDWDGISGDLDSYTFNPEYWYMLVFGIQSVGGWGTYGTFEARFLGSDQSYLSDDCAQDHYLNDDPGSPGCGSILTANFMLTGVGNTSAPRDVFTITTNISTTTNWSPLATYIISGNVTVESGVTLNIFQDTTIKFDTATSSSLIVDGTVNATGTGAKPVIFTSLKDDTRGDTNNNASSTLPAQGDWAGIKVNSGGVANFSNSLFSYAGAGVNQASVHNNGGDLNLTNSEIVYSSNSGVRNDSGTTTLSSVIFGFNSYGIYKNGGNISIDGDSVIQNSSNFGIYNNTVNSITATNVFWGDHTGPYHSTNTGGSGDVVTDYVIFSPWNTNLHYFLDSNSVNLDDDAIYLTGTTTYTAELSLATTTWNNLGSITIASTTDPATIKIVDIQEVDGEDLFFTANYHRASNPDEIQFNMYFMENISLNKRVNVITHEFGHALGLNHSYIGNIMYQFVTDQTYVGNQDLFDYFDLW